MRRVTRLLLAIHAAAALTLLATNIQYLDRPLRTDEVDFRMQARDGIRVHGRPVIYPGETLVELSPLYARYGAFYGMWHPPLYQYVLAAAISISPSADWAARGVGLICLLVSLFVMWRISTEQIGADAPAAVRALPLSLAVLSPLVTQGSLIVDIDNTVLAPLLLVFLWQYSKTGDPLAPKRLAWLTALFTVSLFAKLTTPPIALAACATWALFREKPLRHLVAVAIIGIGGAAAFWAAYRGYCAALDYPPHFMWELGVGSRSDLVATAKTLTATLRAVRWHVVWFSPVMTTLLVGAVLVRGVQMIRTRRAETVDLFLVFAAATFCAYAVFGAMFGKYTVPAGLAAALAIGVLLAQGWRDWTVPWLPIVVLWLIVIGAVAVVWPVPYVRLPGAADMSSAIGDPRNFTAFAVLSNALLAAWAWTRSTRPTASTQPRGLANMLRVAGLSLALSLAVITPVQESRVLFAAFDNKPLSAGIERGVVDVISYINANAPAAGAVLAPKDIGSYIERLSLRLDDYVALGPAAVEAAARRADVWCIVDSTLFPVVDAAVLSRLRVTHIEEIGTYRVYVLTH
jgi:hypothetical protein